MTTPQISVCIPVYNASKQIERCIDSLFAQTKTDGVEFLFVDDGSTDDSIEIIRNKANSLQALKSKVRIVSHERNKGLHVARQTLVENALGNWIAFVDADDWVDPDYLQKLFALASPDVDIVTSDFFFHRIRNTTVMHDEIAPDGDIAMRLEYKLTDRTADNLWAKLIRRNLFIEHDCSSKTDFMEDQQTTLKLFFFARKIVSAEKPMYHYDHTIQGSITAKTGERHFQEMLIAWEHIDSFLAEQGLAERLAEAVAHQKTVSKANLMLYCQGMKERRRYADVFHDEETHQLKTLSTGYRIMLWLVRHHLWPLVWTYSKYVSLRTLVGK